MLTHACCTPPGAVLLLQIFSGWVLTILFACAICSLFVALGVNSPSRYSIDQIIDAQNVRQLLLFNPHATAAGHL
jgi:hypothetical protein